MPPHPLDTYLATLHTYRATRDASDELSYYTALAELLNAVGRTLDPPVVFMAQPKGTSDARPDGGFYSRTQIVDGEDAATMLSQRRPSHGVVEVKGTGDDAREIAESRQVRRYLARYQQVLVTNYREFVLVGRDDEGNAALLESFAIAPNEAAFWALARDPRRAAPKLWESLHLYLRRVMLRAAPITTPADVAGLLAAYAREALRRVEGSSLPALRGVRESLERALGLQFRGARGEHLFRSTLVQTLWYGTFSAWVLWSRGRAHDDRTVRFAWRESAWSLRVPIIRALFEMVASPARLGPLGLVELLDWTDDVLNRVDRRAFFEAFDQEHAVQYFYEPFLEEFDPELRREMGVWYTPREVVQYQVAQVDRVLREELGVEDGLASRQVFVLDPCCGTGAYLVETLRHIAASLDAAGAGATMGARLKEAAMDRIMGFELMPAPFVVAHLQLGLMLQSVNAPLAGGAAGAPGERAAVFLTNALTGWEPEEGPKQRLLFEELEEERDAAERVKRDAPILVVIGNPPYYGFAGMAVDEERSLSTAYRTTTRTPRPRGQGLNDLYVRFFRMAERRICDRTGRGVVSLITNYSWLDKSSFPGMRERLLDAFDGIWIDNLNGDSRATGKLTPDGDPDPSVFSTPLNPEGIQVGTAIATLVRRPDHVPATVVRYRNLWGRDKRADLMASRDHDGRTLYEEFAPALELGLAFTPARVAANYLAWPRLVDLFPRFLPGVQTKRDDVVTDIDRSTLEGRMARYFDPGVSHAEMAILSPDAMRSTKRFDAVAAREHLQQRGMLPAHLVRHVYRPFDLRWIYWEPETKLLGEKSPAYFPEVFDGNRWLVTQQAARRGWQPPQHIRSLGALHLVESSASMFPLLLRAPDEEPAEAPAQQGLFDEGGSTPAVEAGPATARGAVTATVAAGGRAARWNASPEALDYLRGVGMEEGVPALFAHAFAVLHAPTYAETHGDALRQDWARLPLPATAEGLRQSAALGRQVEALLDPERGVAGVTTGRVRNGLRSVGMLRTTSARNADPGSGDFAVTARWGTQQRTGIVMPGPGRAVERDYTADELAAFADDGVPEAHVRALLGERTVDVHLNAHTFWTNVPARVFEFEIGGYQVLRKWLSYREQAILGRDLTLEEIDDLTATTRRLAALRLLEPELDANYEAAVAAAAAWPPAAAPVAEAGAAR